MIELFAADTPNGKKITIMLEELNCDYKLSKIDLSKMNNLQLTLKKLAPLVKFQ